MKKIALITFLVMLFSCQADNNIILKSSEVTNIHISERSDFIANLIGEPKDGLLLDIEALKKVGPKKFARPFKFFIYHENGQTDTIWSNGKIHKLNSELDCFESSENLIEKYTVK